MIRHVARHMHPGGGPRQGEDLLADRHRRRRRVIPWPSANPSGRGEPDGARRPMSEGTGRRISDPVIPSRTGCPPRRASAGCLALRDHSFPNHRYGHIPRAVGHRIGSRSPSRDHRKAAARRNRAAVVRGSIPDHRWYSLPAPLVGAAGPRQLPVRVSDCSKSWRPGLQRLPQL
jgi:hypothetical protein